MVTKKEKMKEEIGKLRNELKAVKKKGQAHVAVTKGLEKRVRELEADVKRLKKKL